jgi:hypothetical protein
VASLMINWTGYFKYRAALRGFELEKLEVIIRHSTERYFDTETERHVVVGRHNLQLVIIPYDVDNETISPVTVHPISRQQVKFRLNTRRFIHE